MYFAVKNSYCDASAKSGCCIQLLSVSHVPGITLCRVPRSRQLFSLFPFQSWIGLSPAWNCCLPFLTEQLPALEVPRRVVQAPFLPQEKRPWWLDSVTCAMGWACARLALQQLVLFWSSWWMEPVSSSFCYISNRDNFSVSCTHLWPKTCAQPGGSQWKVTFPTAQCSLAGSGSSLCCFNSVHFKDLTQMFMESFGLHISA